MDGHKCINTCTLVLTHTHTELTLNSWECLQCERVVRSLRLAQWPVRCLCLHCTHSSNSGCFRPLLAFRHTLRLAFVEDAHKTVKAWPRVALAKQGPSSLRNQGDFQKCTWYMWPSLLLIMFQHSSRGHRDIKCVQFSEFFHITKLLLQISWQAEFTRWQFLYLLPLSRMRKRVFKEGATFAVLIITVLTVHVHSVRLDWAGGGLVLISLEFCYSSDKLYINHPGWVIKQIKIIWLLWIQIQSATSAYAIPLNPSMLFIFSLAFRCLRFLHQRPDVFRYKKVVFSFWRCQSAFPYTIQLCCIYKGHLCYSLVSLMSWQSCGAA